MLCGKLAVLNKRADEFIATLEMSFKNVGDIVMTYEEYFCFQSGGRLRPG